MAHFGEGLPGQPAEPRPVRGQGAQVHPVHVTPVRQPRSVDARAHRERTQLGHGLRRHGARLPLAIGVVGIGAMLGRKSVDAVTPSNSGLEQFLNLRHLLINA